MQFFMWLHPQNPLLPPAGEKPIDIIPQIPSWLQDNSTPQGLQNCEQWPPASFAVLPRADTAHAAQAPLISECPFQTCVFHEVFPAMAFRGNLCSSMVLEGMLLPLSMTSRMEYLQDPCKWFQRFLQESMTSPGEKVFKECEFIFPLLLEAAL
jgi:hypothetical protein